jgi:peptidoglycan hydrolase-like protein with peptidoglycan-binding domain
MTTLGNETVPEGAEGDDDADGGGDRPRARAGRRPRRGLLIGAVIAVVIVMMVGALGLGGHGAERAGSRSPHTGATVHVTRATLINSLTVDGELNHGAELPLGVRAAGTVTWLPENRKVVRRGETLLRVDDRPIVLLYGTLPMYRDLAQEDGEEEPGDGTAAKHPAATAGAEPTATPSGSPRPGTGTSEPSGGAASSGAAAGHSHKPLRGRDVRQLESNLKALGYSGFAVDEVYSAATAKAVGRWQRNLGLPEAGTVGIGDVVYAPGPVRIARALVRVGAAADGDVLRYTGTKRMVTVNVPVGDAAWAVRGAGVSVILPDGRDVSGKVTGVGGEVSSAPGSDSGAGADGGGRGAADGAAGADPQNLVVPVTIGVSDQRRLGGLDRAPVTVKYVVDKREDVLTVPVSALVALAEGGYGLEAVDGGSSRFVAVRTGLFADGRVEVSGPAIGTGMTVRVAQ